MGYAGEPSPVAASPGTYLRGGCHRPWDTLPRGPAMRNFSFPPANRRIEPSGVRIEPYIPCPDPEGQLVGCRIITCIQVIDSAYQNIGAGVAQLDRAVAYEAKGCGFESHRRQLRFLPCWGSGPPAGQKGPRPSSMVDPRLPQPLPLYTERSRVRVLPGCVKAAAGQWGHLAWRLSHEGGLGRAMARSAGRLLVAPSGHRAFMAGDEEPVHKKWRGGAQCGGSAVV